MTSMTGASTSAASEPITTLSVRPRPDFVETPAVRDLTDRALGYLAAGFPVHFRGPAGTGKTTLALHVAAHLGRPVMLIAGDEEFATSDLVGGRHGYHYRKVVDRFIHTVLKVEEDTGDRWVDHRLTTACRDGYTLIYDEFTRSRPEANNVLLTVLEERLLILPNASGNGAYVKVHPDFRAIFTSNPQEYAGVHEAQDALSDRLVSLQMEYYDRDTEIEIAAARSGLSGDAVTPIVDVARDYRSSGEYEQTPTLRSCIVIAKVVAQQGLRVAADDPRFVRVCIDVLGSKAAPNTSEARERRAKHQNMLLSLIEHHCR